jgi:hypothetical protein
MNINNMDDINQQNLTTNRQEQQQARNKCHGNRKDQRFRRKCRARGIKPGIIKKLLNQRKNNKKKNKQKVNHSDNRIINQMATTTTFSNNVSRVQVTAQSQHTATTTGIDTNKRKRNYLSQQLQNIHQTIPKSTSLVSFEPPLSKKMKEKQATIIIPSIQVDNKRINTNYRFVCFSIYT